MIETIFNYTGEDLGVYSFTDLVDEGRHLASELEAARREICDRVAKRHREIIWSNVIAYRTLDGTRDGVKCSDAQTCWSQVFELARRSEAERRGWEGLYD